LVDAHPSHAIVSGLRVVSPSDFGFFGPFFVLVGWIVSFLIGLLFVVLAARFATRAVLDEIDRDRRRRGPA
jgi:hypothetical protein